MGDVAALGAEGRANVLLSFYDDSSTAENGPFDHACHQRQLTIGLEILPVLLDDAKSGSIPKSLLKRLKQSVLHFVRALTLEWFTTSILKGIFFMLSLKIS